MDVETSDFRLINNLKLQEPSSQQLTLRDLKLMMLQLDESQLPEVHLSIKVSPEIYHHIDTQALFNLKPEVRGPIKGGDFLPATNYQLDLTLRPNLRPHLLGNATSVEEAAAYLLSLSQQPLDPLLNTESWLCLSVKQQQEHTEIGFSTFWSYIINPTVLQQAATTDEPIAECITKFFKDWVSVNASEAKQEIPDDLIREIVGIVQYAVDDVMSDEKGKVLFETVVSFFNINEWPIVLAEDKTSLQLTFQGKNGQWACYASTNEDRQEFVFYSFCPVNVPEPQRPVVAEFLTRANYGLPIGNFEMNFDNGEIHFKTGIDVEGDQLSIALVQQLVYCNVTMMDQYLPGIMAVTYSECAPVDAIAQIEG